MNNLRNRDVEVILIAVVDGLKGFPDAINAAFPDTTVQTLYCASGAPFPELLRMEGSQDRRQGSEADLPSHR